MKKAIPILIITLVISPFAFAQAKSLKLATTTSTYETGIMEYILTPFEKQNNIKVHIISTGTGKAIKLAQNGDVDIILVHAPKAEKKFIEQGYGVDRQNLMHNYFILAGPKNDPAGVGNFSSKEAFQKIYEKKSLFISRGDDSGTHKKEKSIWASCNIIPDWNNYLESGQGMAQTLYMADEKGAYCLVDKASFIFNKGKIDLIALVKDDELLLNSYGVIAVNPEKYPHVEYEFSKKLINYFISDACQDMIAGYKKQGHTLFYPNAHGKIRQ